MNDKILNRNLLSLTHGSPEAANQLSYSKESPLIEFTQARSGHTIPVFLRDGKKKSIHSSFDPVREGIRLCEQQDHEGLLLVLGLGAGFHIKPFLEEKKVSSIIIIENSFEEVKSLLSHIDLSDIFLDRRVSLWISENPGDFSSYLLSRYIPVLSGNLSTISLRSRVLLDHDYYTELTSVVKRTIDQITDDYTVQTHFGKKWFINTLSNLKESEKTTQILSPVKKAYITAAGPSLEKQIPYLREKDSDAAIIATDTSLPVLLANHIKPDLVISIDCQHISYNHFMQGYPEDVPLVLDLASPSFLTRIAKKKIFFTSDHPFSRFVSNEFREFPKLDTSGGNVTHAALSLADIMGAREIYLLGSDFSYPEGKPYARDSYIYPYFYSRCGRTNGIENSIFSFILHNRSIIKEKTENGFRYISKPMIHYKASIEKKASECYGKVIPLKGDGVDIRIPRTKRTSRNEMRIISAGTPWLSCMDFLKSYRKRIAELPDIRVPVPEYLNSLSMEQKEVWITILPTAAQFYKSSGSGDEAIKMALQWSMDLIDRVLASENNSTVINEV